MENPAYGQPGGYGQPANYGQPPPYAPTSVVIQKPPVIATHGHCTGVRPQDYLILSIVSCFFCWPMAICALMYSLNSRNAADTNDFARAECEGRTARNIGIAAIIVGCVIIAVAVGVNAAVGGTTYYCYGYGC